jgi:hypothetical protein
LFDIFNGHCCNIQPCRMRAKHDPYRRADGSAV